MKPQNDFLTSYPGNPATNVGHNMIFNEILFNDSLVFFFYTTAYICLHQSCCCTFYHFDIDMVQVVADVLAIQRAGE